MIGFGYALSGWGVNIREEGGVGGGSRFRVSEGDRSQGIFTGICGINSIGIIYGVR